MDNSIRENIPANKKIKTLLKDYETMDQTAERKLEQSAFDPG